MIDRHSLHPIPALTSERLGVAVSSALLASILTPVLMPFLERSVFLLFLLAVLVSSLYGGLFSGLAATLVSVLGISTTAVLILRDPVDSLLDVVPLTTFILFSVVISVLAQALLAARRRAEQRARDAVVGEESFRELFDSTADAIYVTGPTGRLLNVNRAACELHGHARSSLLGQSWDVLLDATLSDPETLREHVEGAFSGVPQSFEAWVRHADGGSIPIEVKLSAARYFDRDVVIAVARDLSERRRLEEQLRQSQKMDAIGRLAGGVAHDFNNLLTSIRGYASLMHDRVAHDATLLEDLGEIEQAVELATAVTGQLLAFSRKQDFQPRVVSLNDSLERMGSLLRRLIDERVELVVQKDPALGLSLLDEGQIEQVVMNLVVNARDALRQGGRITIRTRNVEALSPPGPHVVLSVEDNGIGMDERTRARIFEPFYTTKDTGHGTGLGLSTVYGIVKQNGGHIEVESVPGGGSTFAVMFPRVADGASRPAYDRDADAAPAAEAGGDHARDLGSGPDAGVVGTGRYADAGGGAVASRGEAGPVSGTILLAEDEAPVRHLVRRVLTRHGYGVIEAANGRAALEAALAHEGPIDALVTDVIMPELTGPELAEQLRAKRPGTPVLFTSGYNEEGMHGNGVVPGLGIAFLQKPFVPDELLRMLGELLEEREIGSR
ncbi:MAG TPA: ATP-binding protein [Longimicrobiales bacterium]|nr:ATP-binding protein [Longimicrobiales bacterium]